VFFIAKIIDSTESYQNRRFWRYRHFFRSGREGTLGGRIWRILRR